MSQFKGELSSGTIFLGVVALNFQNTVVLVSDFITPLFSPSVETIVGDTHRLSFIDAFLVNGRHFIEAFPLLLLALVFVAILMVGSRVRDKTLAYLAFTYGLVYITMASVLFRTDHGLSLNVRHIFPLIFFLLFFIVAYRAPSRAVSIVFIFIGLPMYIYAMVLKNKVIPAYTNMMLWSVSGGPSAKSPIDSPIALMQIRINMKFRIKFNTGTKPAKPNG